MPSGYFLRAGSIGSAFLIDEVRDTSDHEGLHGRTGMRCRQEATPLHLNCDCIPIILAQEPESWRLCRGDDGGASCNGSDEHVRFSFRRGCYDALNPFSSALLGPGTLDHSIGALANIRPRVKLVLGFARLIAVYLRSRHDIADIDILQAAGNSDEECHARIKVLDGSLCLECSAAVASSDLDDRHIPASAVAKEDPLPVNCAPPMHFISNTDMAIVSLDRTY